jgi:hypothetical protein
MTACSEIINEHFSRSVSAKSFGAFFLLINPAEPTAPKKFPGRAAVP